MRQYTHWLNCLGTSRPLITRLARVVLVSSLLLLGAARATWAAPLRLSDQATVSLLTCAPGTETYALFGHSALRVTAPAYHLDQVYNFGTFDFRTQNFYWRFLRGDLRYFLSASSFEDFLDSYRRENRTLTEQVLELTPGEVQRIYTQLETTRYSSARYYRYQFFADNCTTRLFSLITASMATPLVLDSAYAGAPRSYRQLLAPYLAPAPWVNLVMNLGLGWPADRSTTFRQRLFLPVELQTAFAHATRYQRPFVGLERRLFTASEQPGDTTNSGIHPLLCFLLLGCLMVVAGFWQPLGYRAHLLVEQSLRTGLLLVAGAAGCVLLGLQLFSLHAPTHLNYQLLWLLPSHAGLAFARPNLRWRRYTDVSLGLMGVGGVLGGMLYYTQLLPEAGLLFLLLLAQLLVFRRRCAATP